MAPAAAALLPPPPGCGASDQGFNESSSPSLFWRCRDGPLVLKLASAAGGEAEDQQDQQDQQQPQPRPGAALAAFAAASRDSWLVARTVVAALSPTVLLPEAIARSFPAVRELDLSRVRRLTAADIALLPEALPGLTSLRLRANGSGGGGVSSSSSSAHGGNGNNTATPLRESALAPIGRLTRLERLSVRGAHRCRWSVLNRWHALKSLRSLELVGLSNGDAADGAAAGLASFLHATGAATRLTRLVLGDAMGLSFMGDAGLEQLLVLTQQGDSAAAATTTTTTTGAAAAGGGVGGGAGVSAAANRRCPLRSLDLSGCIDVTDAGLAAALRASSATLEELSLHNCLRVTGPGLVAALSGAAASAASAAATTFPLPPRPLWLNPPPLRKLSLRGCGHLDDAALGPALAQLGHLTWLSLQSCAGVRGGVLLALAGVGGAAAEEAGAARAGGARSVAVAGRPPQAASVGSSNNNTRQHHSHSPGCLRLRYLNLSYCSGLVIGEDGRPPAQAAAAAAAAAEEADAPATTTAPPPSLPPLKALALLPELESLDLSGCHGVNPGALGGLERCAALAELRLAGWMGPSTAGAASATATTAAAPPPPSSSSPLPRSLRSVDLRGARFPSPQALAALLRRLPEGIASLDLSRAAVTVSVVAAPVVVVAGEAGEAPGTPAAEETAKGQHQQQQHQPQPGVLAAPIEAIGSSLPNLEALDLSFVRVCVTRAAAQGGGGGASGGGGGGGSGGGGGWEAPSLPPAPPLARRAELAPLGRLERLRVLRLSCVACDGGGEEEEVVAAAEAEAPSSSSSSSSSSDAATTAADAAATALGRSLLLEPTRPSSAYPQGGPRALRGIAPSMMDGAYGRAAAAAAGMVAATTEADGGSGGDKQKQQQQQQQQQQRKREVNASATGALSGRPTKRAVDGEEAEMEQQDEKKRQLASLLASRGGAPLPADATATTTTATAPPLPQLPAHVLWLSQLRRLQEFTLTESAGADDAYLLALAAGPGAALRRADLSGCRRLGGGGGNHEAATTTAPTTPTPLVPASPAKPDPFFLACFSRLPALEALDLSSCAGLGDGAAAAAAAALPSLRSLAMRACPGVGDGGLAAFGSVETCRATRLRELALSGSKRVTCAGAAALVAVAGATVGEDEESGSNNKNSPLQHLESLALEHCPALSDAGAEALALGGARGRLPRLRALSVRGCWRLGDSGAAALLRPSALPSLTRLSVEGCHRLTARCCELAAESDGLLSVSAEREHRERQQQPQQPPEPKPPPVVPSSGLVRVECVGRRPTAVERVPLAAWGEQSRRGGGSNGGGGGGTTTMGAAGGGTGGNNTKAALFHIY